MMKVPFLDLITPHKELEEELVQVFSDSLHAASFVGGSQVQAFEEEFARFCETQYCVAVSSGTDALRFSLAACGIGPGDEVITVPNTFIATTEAISQTGATPAFVDIDEQTYNMDPNKLEDYLRNHKSQFTSRKASDPSCLIKRIDSNNPSNSTNSSNTRPRAVLPVHLYGQPADMDAITEIANRYDLIVIEDACQAHGALYHSRKEKKWKKAGSMGLAAGFSFYPGKNLGACGEGGAVTTDDAAIAQKVMMLRDHGQAKKYYHEFEGYNGRLDSIQAGILRVKLKHLMEWNEGRRRNASLYNNYFARFSPVSRDMKVEGGNGIVPPCEPSWSKGVYHLYILRVQQREELQAYLGEHGIGTGLHYPVPVHLQQAYEGKGFKEGDFPVTEKVAKEILSLPMFPQLSKEQVSYVVSKIKEFLTE